MKIRSIVSSSVGNILEWYDFGLFAIYSSLFAELFFPAVNPHTAILAAFSVFAIGFICRPIGALIFGYLGDSKGRATTLRLSILMISLPTLLIGFLPVYDTIGIWAPISLVAIRIWQGISLGGEYSGNIIYLAETAPQKLRATVTSFASTGANLGVLLATIMGAMCAYFFSEHELKEWAWRIPYIVSGVLSIFIYLTRLKMDETKVFAYLKKKKLVAQNPIKTVFKYNILQMLRTLGIACVGSVYYYFCFVYIPLFLTENLHYSVSKVSVMMTIFFLCMLILVPLAGYLCDRVGRRKMLLFNAAAITLTTVPAYYLLQANSIFLVFFILFILMIISSLEQATTSVAVVENYPIPARYTGLSLSYNISNGFLGGTVPLICVWLANNTHLSLAPAIYIIIYAAITFIVVKFFVPETRSTDLLHTIPFKKKL